MNNVYFTAEGHKYTNLIEDYESVSGLWKPYTPEFKGEEISLKIAFKELDPKAYRKALDTVKYTDPKFIETFWYKTRMEQELFYQRAVEVRARWAAKTQRGTDYHNMKEAIDRSNGFSVNPFDGKKYPLIEWDIKEGYENQSFPGDLKDLPDGYVAEHLVKHDLSKTAGQLDKNYIETIGNKRYIDIDDYKTDKQIDLVPTFYDENKGGLEKLHYPFSHIYNSNFHKYSLKISTYAKILEQSGFIVRNLAITHVLLGDEGEVLSEKMYKIPYKSMEAALALDLRRKNLVNSLRI